VVPGTLGLPGYRRLIETSVSLPAEPASAAVARRFVRDALGEWEAEELIDTAVLLTSELVTNALLHARSAPDLTIRLVDGLLRVSVTDDTPVVPTRKRYGAEAATGRGLLLIETMARAWGSDPSTAGKVVWFELASVDEGRSRSATVDDRASSDAAAGTVGRHGPPSARSLRPPNSRRSPGASARRVRSRAGLGRYR